jgi:outer membrane biogenesis lipoprotein LolB
MLKRRFNRITLLALMLLLLTACSNNDWRTASRESSGMALDPATHTQAIVEFYAADAFSWRGWFAVHT